MKGHEGTEELILLNIHPTLGLPEDIARGVQNGTYERIGGVIRETGSKQIVAWLRDVTPDALRTISTGLQVTTFIGVLNLAASAIGFGVVLSRLNELETRFKELQTVTNSTARKLDLMMDGQAYAALQQARLAMQSELPQNKLHFARSALEGLLRLQVQVRGLLSDTIAEKQFNNAVVFYQYLCLIYVAEVLCYLELGESSTAHDQMEHHHQSLLDYSKLLVEGSLDKMDYPILSPAVLEAMSWDRVLDLHRWVKPEVRTEDLLIALLPKANNHDLQKKAWEIEMSRRNRTPTRQWYVEELRHSQIQQLKVLESLIEDTRRFGSYCVEINTMIEHGTSLADWRNSAHSIDTTSADGIFCLRVLLSQ